MVKASFVLPTRNVDKYIGPLLEAIYSQDFSGEIEVLIIDSSDDRTPEIAKRFPVKFSTEPSSEYNYGRTRNRGAAATTGDILVLLSTDVEIRDRQWLKKLTRHFEDPHVAGVYGRQLPKEDARPMERFFILNTYPAASMAMSAHERTLRRGMVFFSNNNSAIRRSVWERIKIPEMLKGEDQEWAKRAIAAGHRIIYDSEAIVYHSHRYSIPAVFHEYFDSGASMPVVYSGLAAYSALDFVRDGLRFVGAEYGFMIKNGWWYWIPYAIVYDIAKSMGVLLGSRQRFMPLWMKRALCKKKNHWNTYSDVIREPT